MSLQLQIQDQTAEIAGAVFTYKTLPFIEKKRILLKYMKHGKLNPEDSIDMGYEFMRKMITGWKDIEDENGNDIPYSEDVIEKFPIDMALEFMDEIILPSMRNVITTADDIVEKGKKEKELENLE